MESRKYRPKRPKMALVCPMCNVLFERYASEVRHPQPCCSKACSLRLNPTKKKKRVTMTCDGCAAPFEVIESRSKGHRMARFCSDACKFSVVRGENHHGWKGGDKRTWPERMFYKRLTEEVGKCEICEATGALHAHHIKHRSKFPELALVRENILVLCPPCHAAQHPERPGLLAAYLGASAVNHPVRPPHRD